MVPMSPFTLARKELVLYKKVEVPHNPAPVQEYMYVNNYYVDSINYLIRHTNIKWQTTLGMKFVTLFQINESVTTQMERSRCN